MRSIIAIAFAASLACSVPSVASAAEYTVKSGDTLTLIARRTGFTVNQLALMNEKVKNLDHLIAGQRITYFNSRDIADAIKWCNARARKLPAGDLDREFFEYTAQDLKMRNIRFSIDEPNGTHYTNIIVFANALHKHGA